MYGKEALNRAADFILGKKVEGTISAVLPSQIGFARRYAVSTKDGILDAHVSSVSQPLFPFPFHFPRQPHRRGERIEERAIRVRPWIDGQIIHF